MVRGPHLSLRTGQNAVLLVTKDISFVVDRGHVLYRFITKNRTFAEGQDMKMKNEYAILILVPQVWKYAALLFSYTACYFNHHIYNKNNIENVHVQTLKKKIYLRIRYLSRVLCKCIQLLTFDWMFNEKNKIIKTKESLPLQHPCWHETYYLKKWFSCSKMNFEN